MYRRCFLHTIHGEFKCGSQQLVLEAGFDMRLIISIYSKHVAHELVFMKWIRTPEAKNQILTL